MHATWQALQPMQLETSMSFATSGITERASGGCTVVAEWCDIRHSLERDDPVMGAWARHAALHRLPNGQTTLVSRRTLYTGEGGRPPFVLRGDTLTSVRFSYAGRRTEHARRWVAYWTGGKGVYTMGDMEDSAILQALTQLAGAGRVDLNRVLVLRAGDGYTVPPPGRKADSRSAAATSRARSRLTSTPVRSTGPTTATATPTTPSRSGRCSTAWATPTTAR